MHAYRKSDTFGAEKFRSFVLKRRVFILFHTLPDPITSSRNSKDKKAEILVKLGKSRCQNNYAFKAFAFLKNRTFSFILSSKHWMR